MAVLTRSFREKIVTFGDQGGLVGMVTIPAEPRANAPCIVLINSGIIHRVGPHRLYVGFARAFAALGLTVLRFDLSGVGDSARQSGTISLADSVTRDISAALDHVARQFSAEQFVLMGLCSGAYDAFDHALKDPRVVGAAMLDMPGPFRNWSHLVHHAAVRVLRPASWRTLAREIVKVNGAAGRRRRPPVIGVRESATHQRMDADLATLLARKVKLAFIFTGGVANSYNHRSQFRIRFPRAGSHPAVRVEFMDWSDHTFSTRKARAHVTTFLRDWLVDDLE